MMHDFNDLRRFAEAQGFFVTATTGGAHNAGSKHFRGLAIDVRTRDKTVRQCDLFIAKCRRLGIVVRDERRKPIGQKIWSGAHLHLEIGDETAAEVRAFQKAHNLIADGIVGEKTISVLNSLFT